MASTPLLGAIFMFAGNFAPSGYQLCQGQNLSISQNAALFSLLGTTYGGNGTTTFQLPNLQGRVAMHQGSGTGLTPRVIGEFSGTENVTLLTTQMPSHTHQVQIGASNSAGSVNDPTNAVAAMVNTGTVKAPNPAAFGYNSAATGQMAAPVVTPTGGSQPHPNMQP